MGARKVAKGKFSMPGPIGARWIIDNPYCARAMTLRACERPSWRDDKLIAKGARVTALLFFDLACKKGAGHAAQHVIADNVASGIDAEGARHSRSRVMDRGVRLSGFDKTA